MAVYDVSYFIPKFAVFSCDMDKIMLKLFGRPACSLSLSVMMFINYIYVAIIKPKESHFCFWYN